jgi:hypothetical protein
VDAGQAPAGDEHVICTVRENLREAVQLVVEANRELSREELGQGEVIREDLRLAIG